MKKILSFILDDFWFKLIALVLALLLWVYLMGQATHTRTIQVPVLFANMPAGKLLVGELESLKVTARGRAGVLMALVKDDFTAVADLADHWEDGEHRISPKVSTRPQSWPSMAFCNWA